MKTQFILRTSIFVLLITFVISCKKEAPVPQDSTNLEAEETALISNDDNSAESAFYDLKVAGDSAGTVASTKLKSLKKDSCVGVKIINYDANLKTGKVELDFGSTNCTCNDGKQRRGKIEVEYKGDKNVIGTEVIYTPNQYFVNDFGVSGKKTVTYSASNTWTIKVENGVVTKPDGKTITWTSNRVRKMVSGMDTPLNFTDDSFEVSGTSSGKNSAGNDYSFETETPLLFSYGCQYISSGKLKIKRAGKKDAVIDYGNGTCDDKGILTVETWSKEITLKGKLAK
jgi:hypothetical protein